MDFILNIMQVQEDMRNGSIALEKYVITKSLTRPPEAYPDAKSQPHVEVSPRSDMRLGHISESTHFLCFTLSSTHLSYFINIYLAESGGTPFEEKWICYWLLCW